MSNYKLEYTELAHRKNGRNKKYRYFTNIVIKKNHRTVHRLLQLKYRY